MDTLLLVITVLSIGAAFASAAMLLRMKKDEQLRSDARVAALAASVATADDAIRPATAPREGAWASVSGEWQWNPSDAPVAAAPISSGAAVDPNLFGAVQREPTVSGPFAFVGALALIALFAGAAIVVAPMLFGGASNSAAQSTHAGPLELVSLGHSRDASTLTITGIVRNPASGAKREGLTAVLSLIDEHGGLISTKDVPLDYRALGPGEEAPFKVTIPDPGSVARYRVSFRAGTDVVPHVDRRTDAKLASAL